ncbi:hypothetical protein EW026_g1436 [Hermanssonia centrifuga]|uniref:CHAT domain-containing protein n=1 Tax=Hermanssonia centrifuga TaxID=98765 RepID=A0A4S4KT60_9APHY|nr:hypothetical protein EW026_g1436 [Hermanssonia centrifuga]
MHNDSVIISHSECVDDGDIAQASRHYQEALPVLPSNHSSRSHLLEKLALVSMHHFKETGDTEHIKNCIGFLQEVVTLPPSDEEGLIKDENETNRALSSSFHMLGDALMFRFDHLESWDDLEMAVESYTRAIALCSKSDRIIFLQDYVRSLGLRFLKHERLEDIDEAILRQHEVLSLSQKEGLSACDLPLLLSQMGDLLLLRFESAERSEDLDEAIQFHKEAIEKLSVDDERYVAFVDDLIKCLVLRFKKQGRLGDIDNAIDCLRKSTTLWSTENKDGRKPHHSVSSTWNTLGDTLMLRFKELSGMEDIAAAAGAYGQAVATCDQEDPKRRALMHDQARCLQERYERSRKLDDVEAAVKVYRELLASPPEFHSDVDDRRISRITSLHGLGVALDARFEHSQQAEDLEEAISNLREAVTFLPNNSSFQEDLGHALHVRFQLNGRLDDLNEAIGCLSLGPTTLVHVSNNLVGMLLSRYEMTGRSEDLDDAIQQCNEISTLCPTGHPDRAEVLGNFATALFARFSKFEQAEDLDEAIEYRRKAIAISSGSLNQYQHLTNLATTLLCRFEHGGRTEDMDEGLMHLRNALPFARSHAQRAIIMNDLGLATHTRFKNSGEIKDLEEAIACHREALRLRPQGDVERPSSVNNLSNVLTTRFQLFGRTGDLEDAIIAHREILSSVSPSQIDYHILLNNLGGHLQIRFQQLGRLSDLEEAIVHYRHSLSLYLLSHPRRSNYLINLANALTFRFEQLDQIVDLQEAINLSREALSLSHTERANHATLLINLASSLHRRYERLHQVEDQQEILTLRHQAVTARRPSHPQLSLSLMALAASYDDVGRCEEAFELFREAVYQYTSNPRHRLHSAKEWARRARTVGHPSALEAYSKALELLDRCLVTTPTMELQHQFLAEDIADLASDAASSAVEMGKLETAVEMLEQGRALLWSRIRGYRHPLEKLREENVGLADAFEKTSRSLELLLLSSDTDTTDRRVYFDTQMSQNRELSSTFEKLISDIRQLNGFATFLKAAPFKFLRSAAKEGPVILLNINQHRSDVLILSTTYPPLQVSLAGRVYGAVDKLSLNLLEVDRTARDDERYGVPNRPSSIDMGGILRILWNEICKPIVNALRNMGLPIGSRVWWCPVGKLGTLPLHAAGIYDKGMLVEGFPDSYVSSYIPTLSSLITSRETAAGVARVNLLGVGQSNTLSHVSI